MNDPQITTVAIEKQNKAYAFLLFLISPLLVVILAAKDFRKSWAKNIIWLFVIFYGATFVISNDKIDANRYRDQLYEFSIQELTPVNIFSMVYGPESQVLDILQPLLTLTVSLFTTNFHVLFAVFGLVFGYFYSRNIWYLLDRTEGKLEWSAVILMMTFAFVVGFWEINGFRFWTAAHIFFYGVFPYVADRNRKKLWFAVLAIFVH
ncbi:MAG: hypothetical protein ITG00_05110, partial [Flavobacterium sp.]|nr:hypothetical protein [Flavobacterium sp.]